MRSADRSCDPLGYRSRDETDNPAYHLFLR